MALGHAEPSRGATARALVGWALLAVAAVVLTSIGLAGRPAPAATPAIALSLVASGLSNPVFVTESPDSSGRLFIVEKTGRIRILVHGAVLATPFFDVHTSVSQAEEQGLLGLAFSPAFATNHRFYVDYTNLAGNTVVSEYRTSTTTPNVVDWHTGRVVMTVKQPYANHNGGMLAFGKDGYLYIGLGDGGSGGDPGNRAQSLNTLLGKILRIDVNGTTSTHNYRIPASNPYVGKAGLDEIWQYGLRNPWRFSFDKVNGNLWIGDVGQNSWEEIDRAILTSSGPGPRLNWGWRVMEGLHCYNPATGCSSTGKALPVTNYFHDSGRCAVTGGYVYRGSAVPGLAGLYLFGDYCGGQIMAISATPTRPAPISVLLSTGFPISSFGQDRAGELYVCDLGGAVYKIVAA
jgi:glucose/arabinose dehydrogenase